MANGKVVVQKGCNDRPHAEIDQIGHVSHHLGITFGCH